MRCVTIKPKEENGSIKCLHEGIMVSTDENGEQFVFLGEKGPRCKPRKIYLDPDDPPEVVDGMIFHAFPQSKIDEEHEEKSNGEIRRKRTLARAFPSATKVLTRYNTSTPSDYRINGQVKIINGKPRLVKAANGWHNGQRWGDYLYIMDDLDAILVTPAGGGRNDRFVVRNDKGSLSSMPELDYRELAGFENDFKSRVKPQILLSKSLSDDISRENKPALGSHEPNPKIPGAESKTSGSKESESLKDISEDKTISEDSDKSTVVHVEDENVTVVGP